MFEFYLDGNKVKDPINWNDFTETIERGDIIKGLLPKYEIKLKFDSSGWAYLSSLLRSSGFCTLVELKIDYKCSPTDHFETVLNAYIFISDCVFNLNKCQVDCSVIDNNFGARIYNNKNLTAKIDVGYSKNGEAITPASATNITILSTNNIAIGTRDVFGVKDVFRFLVHFMTDGLVDFESTFLTPYDLVETAGWLHIASGEGLRLNNASVPEISFQQLFEEVNKKYPISFTIITGPTGRPTMKIENDSYFYSATPSIGLENIQDLKQSFNKELLYSKIKLGAPSAEFNASLGYFPIIRFLSFAAEEYQLQGECNIDKTLDLSGVFAADSNIVQRITFTDTANTQYDDDVIFVESADGISTFNSVDPITLTNPYYYNANLTNNRVAERYSLANNIAYYLGNNSEAFMASRITTNQNLNAVTFNLISAPIIFQDDFTLPNFDATGAYNPVNGRYTSAASGVYGFEARLRFFIIATVPANFTYSVAFRVLDAGGTVQATYYGATTTTNISSGSYTIIGNRSINVVAGYHVTAHLSIDIASGSGKATSLSVFPNSYFKTTSINNGGGIYEYKDAGSYFVSRFEFEQPLPNVEYKTLKLDLSKAIEFNHGPLTNKVGWIRRMERNYATSDTKWELISNLNNSN